MEAVRQNLQDLTIPKAVDHYPELTTPARYVVHDTTLLASRGHVDAASICKPRPASDDGVDVHGLLHDLRGEIAHVLETVQREGAATRADIDFSSILLAIDRSRIDHEDHLFESGVHGEKK